MERNKLPTLEIAKNERVLFLPELAEMLFHKRGHRTMVVQLILLLLAQSCIDPIQISLPSDANHISINGQVTDLTEPYTVTIKRSGTFGEDATSQIEIPVTRAEVSILTSSSTYSQLMEVDPGIYQTNPANFRGQIGEAYKLRVSLPDANTYESSWESMVPAAEIGEMDFETEVIPKLNDEENIVYHKVVRASTQVDIASSLSSPYIKWDIRGEYQFDEQKPLRPMQTNMTCYVKDDLPLGLIRLLDASKLVGQKAIGQHLVDLPFDFKIANTYCLHVRQQSLSAQAFRFWSQANELTQRNGNLFENSPGRIKGNIVGVDNAEEQVFGFFFVSAVEEKRSFIPLQISASQSSPCPSNDVIIARACFDCLVLRNSSYLQPDYWPK